MTVGNTASKAQPLLLEAEAGSDLRTVAWAGLFTESLQGSEWSMEWPEEWPAGLQGRGADGGRLRAPEASPGCCCVTGQARPAAPRSP